MKTTKKAGFKPTRATYQSQVEFYHRALAQNQKAGDYFYVMSSQWISGSGRYVRKKAIPVGVIEVDFAWRYKDGETKALNHALELVLKRHPRCQRVLLAKKSLISKAFQALKN